MTVASARDSMVGAPSRVMEYFVTAKHKACRPPLSEVGLELGSEGLPACNLQHRVAMTTSVLQVRCLRLKAFD
jgi:hypothetical protein